MSLRVEYPGIKLIQYGPHEMRNELAEVQICFLEDPNNDDKLLPGSLFRMD